MCHRCRLGAGIVKRDFNEWCSLKEKWAKPTDINTERKEDKEREGEKKKIKNHFYAYLIIRPSRSEDEYDNDVVVPFVISQ